MGLRVQGQPQVRQHRLRSPLRPRTHVGIFQSFPQVEGGIQQASGEAMPMHAREMVGGA